MGEKLNRTETVQVRITKYTKKEANAEAQRERRSLSSWIEQAILFYLERKSVR